MQQADPNTRITVPHIYPSKIYSKIDPSADIAIAKLRKRLNEPLFIVCPGPSSTEIDPNHVIGNGPIFRMNTFFLEPEPRFGTIVDAYFWSINNDALYDEIDKVVTEKKYEIRAFFSPLIPRREDNNDDKISRYGKIFKPSSDHWALIGTNAVLGREMMGRPLPTQAFQALATACIIGFREIHLIGVDMYSDPNKRYAFDYPEHMKKRVDAKHYTPRYEGGAHGLERDFVFLQAILSQFPDTKILNASRISPLQKFLSFSPLVDGQPSGALAANDKPSHQTDNEKQRKTDKPGWWDRIRHILYPHKVRLFKIFGRELK